MIKQPIILVGGGGHCLASIDVIEQTKQFRIIGIIDVPEKLGGEVLNYPIIGCDNDIPALKEDCPNFAITAGQIKSPILRQKIYRTIKQCNGKLPVIISPYAYVSQHSQIAEGSMIMHNAIVNAGTTIGKCTIINSNALVEHESKIGDFTHISTASTINGQCEIGSNCFIGSNAVIANNITIADDCIIAAGARVYRPIITRGTYY